MVPQLPWLPALNKQSAMLAVRRLVASASRAAASIALPRWPLVLMPLSKTFGSADIFISYDTTEQSAAAILARTLSARGYSVWWANDLVATGMFRAEIDQRLRDAKAVIVIWSPRARTSKWVIAEAADADDQGKLLNVHTKHIKKPSQQIPKPFGVTHSVPVGDCEKIIAALDRLGVPHSTVKVEVSVCVRDKSARSARQQKRPTNEQAALHFSAATGTAHTGNAGPTLPSTLSTSSAPRKRRTGKQRRGNGNAR